MIDVKNKESILSYKGQLNFEVIGNLITQLKDEADNLEIKINIYKKILTIMIESLENIYKYNDYFDHENSLFPDFLPRFSLTKDDENYYITTSNPIENDHIDNLKEHINRILEMDRDTLKKYYRDTITNGQFSHKGGAGLGFIEMAKIANQNIQYHFEKINDKFSYYTLQITIVTKKKQ